MLFYSSFAGLFDTNYRFFFPRRKQEGWDRWYLSVYRETLCSILSLSPYWILPKFTNHPLRLFNKVTVTFAGHNVEQPTSHNCWAILCKFNFTCKRWQFLYINEYKLSTLQTLDTQMHLTETTWIDLKQAKFCNFLTFCSKICLALVCWPSSRSRSSSFLANEMQTTNTTSINFRLIKVTQDIKRNNKGPCGDNVTHLKSMHT